MINKYVCVWCGEVLMLRPEDNFMKSILSFHLYMASKDRVQVSVARALTSLVFSPAPVNADILLSLSFLPCKMGAEILMPSVGSR